MVKRKLPAKKDARQVCVEVDHLFNSKPMQAYHGAIPNYRAATLARLDPGLPESFEEGTTLTLPSTRVLEIHDALLGKASGFVRYTDMIAKAERDGVPSQRLVQRADRGGRTLTAMNATLDEGKRVSKATWSHQLADGWCVLHLHRRGRPGRGFAWEAEAADPLTCAFPERKGGPFVPSRLARRFTMLLSEAQAMYAGMGTLERKTDGGFDWSRGLSTPRALPEGPAMQGSAGSGDKDDVEVQVLVYEDGWYVYHVIRNAGGGTSTTGNDGAELLYCEPNNCYDPDDPDAPCGAMAVVVPGDTVSFGGDGEQMLPVLFSAQNVVNNLNLLRSIRGRSAIKDRPDMVAAVNATPEEFADLQRLGAVKPVDGDGTAGGRIVYVAGKDIDMTPWQLRTNADLDSLDQAMQLDLQAAEAKLLQQTDADTVANATASAYHMAAGETSERHAGWLQNSAFGFAKLDKMICNAAVNDQDEYGFVNMESLPRRGGVDMGQGEMSTLSADGLDFQYDITVVIKQETEDQKAKRVLNAIYLRDQRVRTQINVIEEDTVDVTARVSELFDDALRLVIEPVLIKRYIVPGIDLAIKTGAGFDFDLKPEDFMPPQPVGAAPNAQPTQSFAPAPIEPTGGGGEAPGAL